MNKVENVVSTVTTNNFLDCCRLCLDLGHETERYNIFDDGASLVNDELTVKAAILRAVGIECTEADGLPTTICEKCLYRLEDTLTFVIQSFQSKTVLEAIQQEALKKNSESLKSWVTQEPQQNHCRFEPKAAEPEKFVALSSDCQIEIIDETYAPSNSGLPASNTDDAQETSDVNDQENNDDDEEYDENDGEYYDDVSEEIDTDPLIRHSIDRSTRPLDSPLQEDGSTDDLTNEADTNAIDAVDFILKNIKRGNKKGSRRSTTNIRRHNCEVCGKCFLRKSNLVDHLRLHANVKLFACELCDMSFVQAGNLKAHLRKHTKEKPFACDICGKRYTQSSAVKTHKRSHTNERCYKCQHCEKGFTNSSDLNKHRLLHSNIRHFTCVLCTGRYFAQKIHLKKHLRRCHGDNDFDDLMARGTLKEGVEVNPENLAGKVQVTL